MNSGVAFKMLGSNNTSAKTSNMPKPSVNSSNESFRREMDKAFDKAENSKIANSKDEANKKNTKDALDKSQNSEKPKDVPKDVQKEKPDNASGTTPKEEVSAEEQALAALQVQQAVTLVMNKDIVKELSPEKMIDAVNDVLAGTISQNSEAESTENPLHTTLAEDGEIKLPFENALDLGKSEMSDTAENQEKQALKQNIGQNLTDENLLQEKVGNDSKGTGKADLPIAETKLNDDAMNMAKENLIGKANNLDLSKVNIKVADAPIDTLKSNMAEQMADKIMYKLSQGKQEFEMELNPRELGKINIKMIFTNGSAELVMSTSNAKAHQLLSTQTEALKAILEGNMGMDSNIHLKQPEANEGQFDRDNFQEQRNGQQNQKQQKEEQKFADSMSFIDRLRLGLVDELEQAV